MGAIVNSTKFFRQINVGFKIPEISNMTHRFSDPELISMGNFEGGPPPSENPLRPYLGPGQKGGS